MVVRKGSTRGLLGICRDFQTKIKFWIPGAVRFRV